MSFIRLKKQGKKLSVVGLGLVAIYVFMMLPLVFFQEKIIFQPTELPKDYVFDFEHEFTEHFLTSKDGAQINAIHFKAKNPKGIILYFHGNAGNLQRWGVITSYFVDLNFDVFIVDYRTYGKSTGALSENKLYNDAKMAYEYVKQSWQEDNIIVYGRSLGSAFAAYVASQYQPQQLILEAPFYSLEDVAKRRFPIFPVSRFLKFKFKNHDYIDKITVPITIIHGTDDLVVPYESGQKLYETVKNTFSTLVTIEGGGHNDLMIFDVYKKTISELLEN